MTATLNCKSYGQFFKRQIIRKAVLHFLQGFIFPRRVLFIWWFLHRVPTFRRNVLPPSSGWINFVQEDADLNGTRNVCILFCMKAKIRSFPTSDRPQPLQPPLTIHQFALSIHFTIHTHQIHSAWRMQAACSSEIMEHQTCLTRRKNRIEQDRAEENRE